MRLVERESHLAELGQLYGDSSRGRGAVAVVTGPVASGKTELMHAFADRVAAEGAVFLEASGSRVEQSLPLALIGQFAYSMALPPAAAERITGLLREEQAEAGPGRVPAADIPPRVMASLCAAVLELASESPVVMGVDDVLYADSASLTCLTYLIRRIRTARVMLVLNVASHTRAPHPHLSTELLRQPRTRRIRLTTLSRSAVTQLLVDRLGEDRALLLGGAAHAAAGGNPLLARALAEDNDALPAAAELRTGEAYRQAVQDCLYRCQPDAVRVAHALAVLGEPVQEASLAELAGMDVAAVTQSMEEFAAAGLVDGARFQHPATGGAILESLDPDHRNRLHRQCARLLHGTGAPADRIAGHLVAVRDVAEPWAADVLVEAAAQAVADGQPKIAVEYLRLASQATVDDTRGIRIRAALAEAEWRIDPAIAVRHLDPLTTALREGRLPDRHALTLGSFLTWHGRADDVAATLDRSAATDSPFLTIATRRVLSYFGAPSPVLPAADLTLVDSVAGVEQILQRCRLDDSSVMLLAGAIVAMVNAERVEPATMWSDRWIAESQDCGAPAWQALFTVIRGMIAIRQGDVTEARRRAETALTLLPAASWGAATGGLLALLLDLSTAAGDLDAARRLLRQPLPGLTFDSPFGVSYLAARGRHQLATGRGHAALGDFRECGRLLTTWGTDAPTLIPWRIDAGRALLHLNRPNEARALAAEQLDRLVDGQDRARGVTLWLLASLSAVTDRPALLREAVHLLQACGARLELAGVLADLGDAHQGMGESSRARVMIRHSWQIATECGAEALRRRLAPKLASDVRTADTAAVAQRHDTETLSSLSDAERRVAALAAQGHTNRYIARRLYITVSTVEQHLTRVYRKLSVNRRTDLPSGTNLLDLAEAG